MCLWASVDYLLPCHAFYSFLLKWSSLYLHIFPHFCSFLKDACLFKTKIIKSSKELRETKKAACCKLFLLPAQLHHHPTQISGTSSAWYLSGSFYSHPPLNAAATPLTQSESSLQFWWSVVSALADGSPEGTGPVGLSVQKSRRFLWLVTWNIFICSCRIFAFCSDVSESRGHTRRELVCQENTLFLNTDSVSGTHFIHKAWARQLIHSDSHLHACCLSPVNASLKRRERRVKHFHGFRSICRVKMWCRWCWISVRRRCRIMTQLTWYLTTVYSQTVFSWAEPQNKKCHHCTMSALSVLWYDSLIVLVYGENAFCTAVEYCEWPLGGVETRLRALTASNS